MTYSCPKCNLTDHIIITATIEVTLEQTQEGDVETEPIDNEHEWDYDSRARCGECGYRGKLSEFKQEDKVRLDLDALSDDDYEDLRRNDCLGLND